MSVRPAHMVLLAGVCCLYGCAASTQGPNANVVRPSREAAQAAAPSDERPSAAESDAEVAGTDAGHPAACDGKPIERVEEYWADGTLKIREEVVIDEDGAQIPHGLTTYFWENGNKKSELSFNCGVQDGPRQTWFDDGQPWSAGEYINGKEHGLWTLWYQTGAKAQQFSMTHGAWDGAQTFWYPDGRKKMEVVWVKGKRQGPLRIWDSEGKLVSQQDYVDGIAQPTPMRFVLQGTDGG